MMQHRIDCAQSLSPSVLLPRTGLTDGFPRQTLVTSKPAKLFRRVSSLLPTTIKSQPPAVSAKPTQCAEVLA